MPFANRLISWYLVNKRSLPWREYPDAYKVWLSEIILQQTRVAQGMPYYNAFLKAFPNVKSLAMADEQQVLRLWQGLGYYSRARNLHLTAKKVAFELGGVFPDSKSELQKLKGIGPYTAAAISSIVNKEPVAVVDGNVYRVLSRIFGLETDIASGGAYREFETLATSLMPTDKPDVFNQALMEFGAMQCVPQKPDCNCCLFNDRCYALAHNRVDSLPVKRKKPKPETRHFNYLVFRDSSDQTLLQKRTDGIWRHLYEFPLVESAAVPQWNDVLEEYRPLGISSVRACENEPVIHKLTHQHLHIRFWKIELNGVLKNGIPQSRINEFPVPAAIDKFINAGGLEM